MTLENLGRSVEACLDGDLDPYTRAHLGDARARITKALDASYSYSASGPTGGTFFWFGQETDKAPR
jgi:hypothetical protein